MVSAGVRFNLAHAGSRMVAFYRKNGTAGTYFAQSEIPATAASTYPFPNLTAQDVQVVGDTLKLLGLHNTGSTEGFLGDGTTGNSFLLLTEVPVW